MTQKMASKSHTLPFHFTEVVLLLRIRTDTLQQYDAPRHPGRQSQQPAEGVEAFTVIERFPEVANYFRSAPLGSQCAVVRAAMSSSRNW
jgi:hypothetical protein